MPKHKDHLGSSPFTHQDDAGAELHTTDPRHFNALFHGGAVAPKRELEEIVLGPSAFGSPDPRTLGHVMSPLVNPASAPSLDPAFQDMQLRSLGDVSTDPDSEEDTSYDSFTKPEVLSMAQARGLDVNTSSTKAEIVAALEEDDEAADGEGDSEPVDESNPDES